MKYLDYSGLVYLWEKLTDKFIPNANGGGGITLKGDGDVEIRANDFSVATKTVSDTDYVTKFAINPGGAIVLGNNANNINSYAELSDGLWLDVTNGSTAGLVSGGSGIKCTNDAVWVGAVNDTTINIDDDNVGNLTAAHFSASEIEFFADGEKIVGVENYQIDREFNVGNETESMNQIKLRASSTNNVTLTPTLNKIVGDTQLKDGTFTLTSASTLKKEFAAGDDTVGLFCTDGTIAQAITNEELATLCV